MVLRVQNHAIFVVRGEFLALVLAGKGAQEGHYGSNLSIAELCIALVKSHIAYSLFHGGTCTIVIVGPGEFYVAQAGNLEAVAVALVLCLLEAAVVLLGEFRATSLEVVLAQAHQFVGVATEVRANMAGGTVVGLEQVVATKLVGGECIVVAQQPLVEL